MSKKITHENIKKVVSRTYNALVYYFNDDNALKFEREIQDYVKQQEEQEKLLELYKRLNKVQTRLSWYKIHTINSDKIEKYEKEVFDITKQIKELENE